VAFVIFAIMAGMVSMILNITMQTKQKNNDLEEEIDGQEQAYYLATQDKTYNASDGKLTFNMGSSSLDIDYQVGDPNSSTDDNELALEYFIGDVDYDSMNGTQKPDESDDDEKTEGSVTSRLDSRIYGSTGIKQITIAMKKDTSYTGTGYRYFLKSSASETVSESALKDGSGEELNDRFGDESEATLSKSNGLKQTYWGAQYRLIFPSKILDCGYISDLNDFVVDTPTTIVSESTQGDSFAVSRDFELFVPASKTLVLSSRLTSTMSPTTVPGIFSSIDYYYVVLENEITGANNTDGTINLNTVFGTIDNDPNTISTKDLDSENYIFVCYKDYELNSDGTVKVGDYTKNPNVFAAFEKATTE